MKLLNELITLRRDDDQPDTSETDTAFAADDMSGSGACPHCGEDPCTCDDTADEHGEETEHHEEDASQNPHEEGTPEHEAWEAGFAAGLESEDTEQQEPEGEEHLDVDLSDEDNEASNPYAPTHTQKHADWDESFQRAHEQLKRHAKNPYAPTHTQKHADWDSTHKSGEDEEFYDNDDDEFAGGYETQLYPVRGVKQMIAQSDDWYDVMFNSSKQVHNRLPKGSKLVIQIHAPQDTYRPGSVCGEVYRSPKGRFYYREILTGDYDDQWSPVSVRLLNQLVKWQEENEEETNPHEQGTPEHKTWEENRRSRIIRKKAAFRAGTLFPRPGMKRLGVPRIRVGGEDEEMMTSTEHGTDDVDEMTIARAYDRALKQGVAAPIAQKRIMQWYGIHNFDYIEDIHNKWLKGNEENEEMSYKEQDARYGRHIVCPDENDRCFFGDEDKCPKINDIYDAENAEDQSIHHHRYGGREDEEASRKYVVYFDATGAGRGPEEIAGPFDTEREALTWKEENGYANDSDIFVDFADAGRNEENEEGGIDGDRGAATSGAPVDSVQPEQQHGDAADASNNMGRAGSEQQPSQDKPAEENPDLDQIANKASEDPDHQGLIRKVPNAHLVYKRQTDEGNYQELWVYNAGALKDSMDVRKAILAGTDIPVGKSRSPDGAQEYEIWTSGNVEMVLIKGLPN